MLFFIMTHIIVWFEFKEIWTGVLLYGKWCLNVKSSTRVDIAALFNSSDFETKDVTSNVFNPTKKTYKISIHRLRIHTIFTSNKY